MINFIGIIIYYVIRPQPQNPKAALFQQNMGAGTSPRDAVPQWRLEAVPAPNLWLKAMAEQPLDEFDVSELVDAIYADHDVGKPTKADATTRSRRRTTRPHRHW